MVKLSLAAGVAVALSTSAHAEPWHVEPSVLIGVENFDYHEDVPPPLQSKHHGNQPTGRVEALVTSPNGRWYARAWFGLTGGTMKFEGSDQAGNPITPVDDATGHMTDSELDVGHRWTVIRDRLSIGGYLGVGRRTWDRDLRPIGDGGYREDYAWYTFPVSFVADVQIMPEWTASFEATAMIPDPGNMHLHLSDFDPTYSDLDVALNNQLDPRLRLNTAYTINDQLKIVAEATYEESWMLQGPGTMLLVNGAPTNPVMYASEPETHTRRISLLAGASYRF
jgi:hypothetical protein